MNCGKAMVFAPVVLPWMLRMLRFYSRRFEGIGVRMTFALAAWRRSLC
jgi:hypothetical protein